MEDLAQLTASCRYVQVAYRKGLYTVDASTMLVGEDGFSATFRGEAKKLEGAIKLCYAKLTFYQEMYKHKERMKNERDKLNPKL